MKNSILRVARSTSDFAPLLRFYCDGLAFEVIDCFHGHRGYDGIILGHRAAPYHLEFTKEENALPIPKPHDECLLVFYVPDRGEFNVVIDRMVRAGHTPILSRNPYWNTNGMTFEDADGFRIVIASINWDQ